MVENSSPRTYADMKLILGDQGSGKTCTGVALAKDDYYEQLNGIQSSSGNIIKSKCLSLEDRLYLEKCGVYPNIFKHVRVFSDDSKESKIIKIPNDYRVLSSVKIFSNFHLFGLKYAG